MKGANLVKTQYLEASKEKLPSPSFSPLWNYTAQQFCMFSLILLTCRRQEALTAGKLHKLEHTGTGLHVGAQCFHITLLAYSLWLPQKPPLPLENLHKTTTLLCQWIFPLSAAAHVAMERRKLRFIPTPSGFYLSATPGIPFLWGLSKGCHRVTLSISFRRQ